MLSCVCAWKVWCQTVLNSASESNSNPLGLTQYRSLISVPSEVFLESMVWHLFLVCVLKAWAISLVLFVLRIGSAKPDSTEAHSIALDGTFRRLFCESLATSILESSKGIWGAGCCCCACANFLCSNFSNSNCWTSYTLCCSNLCCSAGLGS